MKNLENNGERMDINYYSLDYDSYDIVQKSHYKRYEFATSLLGDADVVGDMACGSGYGSMMMQTRCKSVIGYDIDESTVNEVVSRYGHESKVEFYTKNLLEVTDENRFDKVVSFETIEHFYEEEITRLIPIFHRSLKKEGLLIFSTPYNQVKCEASMKFHRTFYITEETIQALLGDLFKVEATYYQDYNTHELKLGIERKDFIVCVARKVG